jgi:Ala-tRNA(Pro) deacylase
MPVKKLREFLDKNAVKYVTMSHSPAYTAQEIAASAHVAGKELAKTVMVKVDGAMALAVLPATLNVNFQLLRDLVGSERVELATENDFRDAFPECELGAMPPFGNLYGMQVYVAQQLAEDELIAFNAGSHTELIQLAYEDFERLVAPKVLQFAT